MRARTEDKRVVPVVYFAFAGQVTKARAWFALFVLLAILGLSACGDLATSPETVGADCTAVTLNHSGVVECHVSGPARRASDFMAVDTSAVLSL